MRFRQFRGVELGADGSDSQWILDRVYKSPDHEFVSSAGRSVEWGDTGSSTVGAEASTPTCRRSISPKGCGSAVHPVMDQAVAITGQLGYAIPARSFHHEGSCAPGLGQGGQEERQFRPGV